MGDIQCNTRQNTLRVGRLLRGEVDDDETAWCRLCFELLYANGSPVQMDLSGRHGDHVDVMEPSGASSTRRKITEPIFAVDSRRKDKRTAGGTRVFHSAVHLDTASANDTESCELKFSTNMTSRQHDRQNFIWRVTVSASFNGDDVVMASGQTDEFEYVARRLKTPLKKARKDPTEDGAAIVSLKRKKKPAGHLGMDMSDSESDVEMHDEPTGDLAPRMRRSTRKAAVACRESVSKFMEQTEDPAERHSASAANAGAGMGSRMGLGSVADPPPLQARPPMLPSRSPPVLGSPGPNMGLGHQFPLPRGPHQITIPATTPKATAEEDIMRQPTSGGRNLCRVESIDNMEWRQQPRRHILDEDQDELDMSLLLSSQGGSEEDLLSLVDSPLPITSRNTSVDSLLLARCVSSDYNLQQIASANTVPVANSLNETLREKEASPTTLQN